MNIAFAWMELTGVTSITVPVGETIDDDTAMPLKAVVLINALEICAVEEYNTSVTVKQEGSNIETFSKHTLVILKSGTSVRVLETAEELKGRMQKALQELSVEMQSQQMQAQVMAQKKLREQQQGIAVAQIDPNSIRAAGQ